MANRINLEQPFKTDGGEAIVESSKGSIVFESSSFDTIRHPNCKLFFSGKGDACQECRSLDKKFQIYSKRDTQKRDNRTSDSSFVNLRYLSKDELIERLRNTQQAKRVAIHQTMSLMDKLNKMIEKEGVELEQDHHAIVKKVIETESPQIEEGTPQWLLWQQQLKYASLNNAKSMPLIVRFALSIYHSSPAAYRQLINKKNEFLVLPSVNTLRKYTNFTEGSSGFNPDIIARLIEDSGLKDLNDLQKNVSILFDEMKIKGDLVYNKATGKLKGFTEMGDLNEELMRSMEQSPEDRELARYVNMFMVRGIFTNLHYPFAFFASQGLTGDQLYPCCIEATGVLESIGFKVRAWVCDGASPNRKFFKIAQSLENCDSDPVYWTENPFDHSRRIYFFSDYCHLLKTTRNNIENSHGNQNTRNLHVSLLLFSKKE